MYDQRAGEYQFCFLGCCLINSSHNILMVWRYNLFSQLHLCVSLNSVQFWYSQDSANNHQFTRDNVLVKDVQNSNQIWSDHILFQFRNYSDEGPKAMENHGKFPLETFSKIFLGIESKSICRCFIELGAYLENDGVCGGLTFANSSSLAPCNTEKHKLCPRKELLTRKSTAVLTSLDYQGVSFTSPPSPFTLQRTCNMIWAFWYFGILKEAVEIILYKY